MRIDFAAPGHFTARDLAHGLPVVVALVPPIEPRPIAVTFADPAAPLQRAALDPASAILLAPLAVELVRQPLSAPGSLPVIDTRRQEWIGALAERIDMLREAAGPRETSIRLSPDALGAVDVSVSQDGDRVNVRITAETPAARALLAEAQPRLAELAEARGLRLGQTSIDGGAAGQGQGQRHEPGARQLPSAPPRARAEDIQTEERIA